MTSLQCVIRVCVYVCVFALLYHDMSRVCVYICVPFCLAFRLSWEHWCRLTVAYARIVISRCCINCGIKPKNSSGERFLESQRRVIPWKSGSLTAGTSSSICRRPRRFVIDFSITSSIHFVLSTTLSIRHRFVVFIRFACKPKIVFHHCWYEALLIWGTADVRHCWREALLTWRTADVAHCWRDALLICNALPAWHAVVHYLRSSLVTFNWRRNALLRKHAQSCT